jgi:hypothetical protein
MPTTFGPFSGSQHNYTYPLRRRQDDYGDYGDAPVYPRSRTAPIVINEAPKPYVPYQDTPEVRNNFANSIARNLGTAAPTPSSPTASSALPVGVAAPTPRQYKPGELSAQGRLYQSQIHELDKQINPFLRRQQNWVNGKPRDITIPNLSADESKQLQGLQDQRKTLLGQYQDTLKQRGGLVDSAPTPSPAFAAAPPLTAPLPVGVRAPVNSINGTVSQTPYKPGTIPMSAEELAGMKETHNAADFAALAKKYGVDPGLAAPSSTYSTANVTNVPISTLGTDKSGGAPFTAHPHGGGTFAGTDANHPPDGVTLTAAPNQSAPGPTIASINGTTQHGGGFTPIPTLSAPSPTPPTQNPVGPTLNGAPLASAPTPTTRPAPTLAPTPYGPPGAPPANGAYTESYPTPAPTTQPFSPVVDPTHAPMGSPASYSQATPLLLKPGEKFIGNDLVLRPGQGGHIEPIGRAPVGGGGPGMQTLATTQPSQQTNTPYVPPGGQLQPDGSLLHQGKRWVRGMNNGQPGWVLAG